MISIYLAFLICSEVRSAGAPHTSPHTVCTAG
uniref:Uncharacterized protein n=1 Tax=Siphoviridae sp. ctBLh2 TaxID=2827803 RepID=A0A8S5S398_9CAUD|nr:MAG TPA: hypothetical protein [Siphoviridae sp. ctBLh2]